ncbi:MAG: hypothetical protein H0T46_01815 [Deltaproteobacteria bacterium]|nr:hypothetical protein [Deltaproteobacteria bacterium]
MSKANTSAKTTPPEPPSWERILAHFESLAELNIRSLRENRERRLQEYARSVGIIGLSLHIAASQSLMILVARGPEGLREDLRPLVPYARTEAEQMFRDYYRPDDTVTTNALASATGVCMYECLGLDADGALAVFKPHLIRIATSRRDEYVFDHWSRALAALVLDDRRTWGPIAGLLPNDPIPFTPGATFEFNVQGFIVHLAGAIVHGRPFDDVLPAWRDFLRSYPYLTRINMANTTTLLWSARLVHHHIAGNPLGTTAAFLYEEIRAALASESEAKS